MSTQIVQTTHPTLFHDDDDQNERTATIEQKNNIIIIQALYYTNQINSIQMSWATCYAGSNNIHFNFPPIMADGRNYADWQPGAVINERIKEQAGITSNSQYRQFLTHNATQIMQANQVEACNQCGSCVFNTSNPLQPQPNVPFVFSGVLDRSQPFGYENSDLKNYYLTRQQLQARMIAPVITQHELLVRGYPTPN